MRRGALTTRAQAWLELLRLPNLFTVPGDVLVGWCLLGGGSLRTLLLTIAASLSLYCVGLLLNDVFDARIDARERPARPIPSGRASRAAVAAVAILLTALALALPTGARLCALTLLAAIVFYDACAKHAAGLGVFTMGCCRGLNVLLGAACAAAPFAEVLRTPLLLCAIAFFILYILLLSVVARNEAAPDAVPSRLLRWSPIALTLLIAIPLALTRHLALLWAPPAAAALMIPFLRRRGDVPALVSALIRHLIPLQLLWCLPALPAPELLIPLFALLYLCAHLTARRISGS